MKKNVSSKKNQISENFLEQRRFPITEKILSSAMTQAIRNQCKSADWRNFRKKSGADDESIKKFRLI